MANKINWVERTKEYLAQGFSHEQVVEMIKAEMAASNTVPTVQKTTTQKKTGTEKKAENKPQMTRKEAIKAWAEKKFTEEERKAFGEKKKEERDKQKMAYELTNAHFEEKVEYKVWRAKYNEILKSL